MTGCDPSCGGKFGPSTGVAGVEELENQGIEVEQRFEGREAELRGCASPGGAWERGLGGGDMCRPRSRFGLLGSGASSYFQSSFFDSSILVFGLLLENDFSVIYDWGMD
jgi:hypothetical protein